MDILQTIIAHKQQEVERQREAVSLATMIELADLCMDCPTRSLREALAASETGIIAEFKRKSPSKGWLHPGAKVADVVPLYAEAGAAACSILTDSQFFGGAIADLQQARQRVSLPLLRKDFVIDPYQLFQARVIGADAVLLIAACLSPERCAELAETAHSLQLEVLLEVHDAKELDHVNEHIDLLGVNNRHLGTFHTDVEQSFALVERLKGCAPLLVSESGISQADTVKQLREAGFKGFLIGETFMKTAHPGETLRQFINQLR